MELRCCNTESEMTKPNPMTCYSCAHSQQAHRVSDNEPVLVCALRGQIADKRCDKFEFEPGSDEGEKDA